MIKDLKMNNKFQNTLNGSIIGISLSSIFVFIMIRDSEVTKNLQEIRIIIQVITLFIICLYHLANSIVIFF